MIRDGCSDDARGLSSRTYQSDDPSRDLYERHVLVPRFSYDPTVGAAVQSLRSLMHLSMVANVAACKVCAAGMADWPGFDVADRAMSPRTTSRTPSPRSSTSSSWSE